MCLLTFPNQNDLNLEDRKQKLKRQAKCWLSIESILRSRGSFCIEPDTQECLLFFLCQWQGPGGERIHHSRWKSGKLSRVRIAKLCGNEAKSPGLSLLQGCYHQLHLYAPLAWFPLSWVRNGEQFDKMKAFTSLASGWIFSKVMLKHCCGYRKCHTELVKFHWSSWKLVTCQQNSNWESERVESITGHVSVNLFWIWSSHSLRPFHPQFCRIASPVNLSSDVLFIPTWNDATIPVALKLTQIRAGLTLDRTIAATLACTLWVPGLLLLTQWLALGFLACGSWGCPAGLSRGVDKDPCPQLSILLVWASLICFCRGRSLTEMSCPFLSSCHQIADTHLLLKGRTLNFLSDGEHHIAFSQYLHRLFLAAYTQYFSSKMC